MTVDDRITLLCKARAILEGHERVSISRATELVVRVLNDMVNERINACSE